MLLLALTHYAYFLQQYSSILPKPFRIDLCNLDQEVAIESSHCFLLFDEHYDLAFYFPTTDSIVNATGYGACLWVIEFIRRVQELTYCSRRRW